MSISFQIDLPPLVKTWVEQQAATEGYESPSEFILELVRREQQRLRKANIENALLQALDSGNSTPMAAEDWKRIRQEGKKRLATKKRKPS